MNEIRIKQHIKELKVYSVTHQYNWTLVAKNGRELAISKPYKTKWHCIEGAINVIKKPYRIVDEVQDRRERA